MNEISKMKCGFCGKVGKDVTNLFHNETKTAIICIDCVFQCINDFHTWIKKGMENSKIKGGS